MKQIILVTDGCSNVGIQPAAAAAYAREEGVPVHVIGVVDQGDIGEKGAEEIHDIARAGGGMSRIVQPDLLAQTMQMMTRMTVAQTIQQAVGRELQQLLGTSRLEALPPEQREEVVRAADELGESTPLKVALLIDASASMKPKLKTVEEAIRDLLLSLAARAGQSEIAVLHFPGPGGQGAVLDLPWTSELAKVRNLFYKISMKGTTPTGPAILDALHYIIGEVRGQTDGEAADMPVPAIRGPAKDGLWDDYVI